MPNILTDTETRAVQGWLAKNECYPADEIDGVVGPKFRAGLRKALGSYFPKADEAAAVFPEADYKAIVAHYGSPGDEANLVAFEFPFPCVLYTRDGAPVRKTRVHKLVAEPLGKLLTEMEQQFGMAYIIRHGLNVYAGCFNDRSVRGGTAKSHHAWGIAVDWNPGENGNRTPWRADMVGRSGYAVMPVEVVEFWEAHGWFSAARQWGRDAMHFAALATA